jgi:hypothetical protein
MLLRHMCLRTGVDLGHSSALAIRADMRLGVPGSEELVRVVQLILILSCTHYEQKAWRWRYFGMPLTGMSLIPIFSSL